MATKKTQRIRCVAAGYIPVEMTVAALDRWNCGEFADNDNDESEAYDAGDDRWIPFREAFEEFPELESATIEIDQAAIDSDMNYRRSRPSHHECGADRLASLLKLDRTVVQRLMYRHCIDPERVDLRETETIRAIRDDICVPLENEFIRRDTGDSDIRRHMRRQYRIDRPEDIGAWFGPAMASAVDRKRKLKSTL